MGFGGLVVLELRKRIDSRGAHIGAAALVLAVVASALAGAAVVGRNTPAAVAEVVVVAGLPAVLSAALIGVVVGVGDAPYGGERDAVLRGLSRTAVFTARGVVAVLFAAALVVLVFLASVGATGILWLGGSGLSAEGVGARVGELSALVVTGCTTGFGIGASCRSLAPAILTVLVVVLLVDAALSVAGGWSVYLRFSTVQNALVGSAGLLPAVTSAAIWIGVPLVTGWFRTTRSRLT